MGNTKMTDKQKVTTMADSDYVFGNFGGKVGQMSIPDFRSNLKDDSPDMSALQSRISAVEDKNTEQDARIYENKKKIESVENKLNNYADTFPQNPVASSDSNGLMSAADKMKLDALYIGEGGSTVDNDLLTEVLNTAIDAKTTALEAKDIADATKSELELQVVYDVSAHNDGAVFESLQSLLSSSNLDTLIPTSVRHGGMSIRFIQGSVQSSDNKYVQFRLMTADWRTTVANWQGVDDEPTADSENLVKSCGVAKSISDINEKLVGYVEKYSGQTVVNAGRETNYNDNRNRSNVSIPQGKSVSFILHRSPNMENVPVRIWLSKNSNGESVQNYDNISNITGNQVAYTNNLGFDIKSISFLVLAKDSPSSAGELSIDTNFNDGYEQDINSIKNSIPDITSNINKLKDVVRGNFEKEELTLSSGYVVVPFSKPISEGSIINKYKFNGYTFLIDENGNQDISLNTVDFPYTTLKKYIAIKGNRDGDLLIEYSNGIIKNLTDEVNELKEFNKIVSEKTEHYDSIIPKIENRITLMDVLSHWMNNEKFPIGFLGDSTTDGVSTSNWDENTSSHCTCDGIAYGVTKVLTYSDSFATTVNSIPITERTANIKVSFYCRGFFVKEYTGASFDDSSFGNESNWLTIDSSEYFGKGDWICEEAYPYLLEQLLRKELNNTSLRVYNIGYSGASFNNMKERLKELLSGAYSDVKMVGIELGINDRGGKESDIEYYNSLIENLKYYVEYMLSVGITPFMVTTQTWLQNGDNGSGTFDPINQNYVQILCNKAKYEVAKMYGLEVIDMNSWGAKILRCSEYPLNNITQDSFHFRDIGHKLEADYLFTCFIPWILNTNFENKIYVGVTNHNAKSGIITANYIYGNRAETNDGFRKQINKNKGNTNDVLIYDAYVFVNESGAYKVSYHTSIASGYIVIDGDENNKISIVDVELDLGKWDMGLHHVQVYTGESTTVAFKGFLLEKVVQ